jgi:hypothetical protein
MENTTNHQLTAEEIKHLILSDRLCPYPRPAYIPHDYNAAVVQEVMSLSPEQRQAWLVERRKQRAALLASLAPPV